jgi:DNA polymerase-3 subunit epsilon
MRVLPQLDCVVVDFETANRRASSACALGVVVLAQGRIIDQQEWQFQPPGIAFNGQNTRTHGITALSVKDSPRLSELWVEIKPYFEGRHVLAHCARFDIGVLRCSLRVFGIPCPTFEYTCTWLVAKRTWPRFGKHGLSYLADRLGIELDHHNPTSDAHACSAIAVRACQLHGIGSIADLETRVGLTRGRVTDALHTPPSAIRRHLSRK